MEKEELLQLAAKWAVESDDRKILVVLKDKSRGMFGSKGSVAELTNLLVSATKDNQILKKSIVFANYILREKGLLNDQDNLGTGYANEN